MVSVNMLLMHGASSVKRNMQYLQTLSCHALCECDVVTEPLASRATVTPWITSC